MTGIFFKGLDKSTLSFGERPVICNIAKQEKRWGRSGYVAELSSGEKGKEEEENSSSNQRST